MQISGKVTKGKQKGRVLGFPTANIPLSKKIPEGIYISQTKFNNQLYPSLTYIGEQQISETYLINIQLDLYGQVLEIKLLKKIRENKKFDSPKELIEAMGTDKKEAEKYGH